VIVSLITPYEEQRKMIREILLDERLLEVYVKCDLETCEQRDPKGLYKKARAGEIQHFTGISDPFEEPANADVVVDSARLDVNECVVTIAGALSDLLKRN
jgi:adenylylsulfate kinase